ncbi:MAG: hypothetical protein M0D55_19510 [Elusimicrobiota bacterium]|nr:MAG: hypothetical protein M0D55_19510 [Elusimicrobiota bacterium]
MRLGTIAEQRGISLPGRGPLRWILIFVLFVLWIPIGVLLTILILTPPTYMLMVIAANFHLERYVSSTIWVIALVGLAYVYRMGYHYAARRLHY